MTYTVQLCPGHPGEGQGSRQAGVPVSWNPGISTSLVRDDGAGKHGAKYYVFFEDG